MNIKAKYALIICFESIVSLAILYAFVINGVFLDPKSGFNTVSNFIGFVLLSGLFGSGIVTGFSEYLKFKTGFHAPKTSKATHYLRHAGHFQVLDPPHSSTLQDLDATTDSAEKTVDAADKTLLPQIKAHPYVTIDGKEPQQPTSILHSRKFLLGGFLIALLIGVASYFWIFAK